MTRATKHLSPFIETGFLLAPNDKTVKLGIERPENIGFNPRFYNLYVI